MKLDDAVTFLQESVLHANSAQFSTTKLHNAIKAACYRFLRETDCSTSKVDIPLTPNSELVDVQTYIPGFEISWFIRARIGYQPVERVPWQTIVYEYQDATPTGQPRYIGFDTNSHVAVVPTPIVDTTLTVTHRQPLLTFTSGTTGNPTLNIPDEWVYDVISMGARGHLLRGIPDMPDAQPSLELFESLIVRARAAFAGIRTDIHDRQTVR